MKEVSRLVVKTNWIEELLHHNTTYINLCIDPNKTTGIVTVINGSDWEDFEVHIERLSKSTYRIRAREFEMTFVYDNGFPFESHFKATQEPTCSFFKRILCKGRT